MQTMNPDMKKVDTNISLRLNESEYEELIRLRARTAFLEAENEVIKNLQKIKKLCKKHWMKTKQLKN